MAVLSIVVATVIGLFIVLFFKLEKKRKKFDKLGGPRSIPIFGNVHQMKISPTGNLVLTYLKIML